MVPEGQPRSWHLLSVPKQLALATLWLRHSRLVSTYCHQASGLCPSENQGGASAVLPGLGTPPLATLHQGPTQHWGKLSFPPTSRGVHHTCSMQDASGAGGGCSGVPQGSQRKTSTPGILLWPPDSPLPQALASPASDEAVLPDLGQHEAQAGACILCLTSAFHGISALWAGERPALSGTLPWLAPRATPRPAQD